MLLDNLYRREQPPELEAHLNKRILQIMKPKDGLLLVNFEEDEEDRHKDAMRMLVNKY